MTHPTILITGANRGIGLEMARQFANHGWRVLACCRNPGEADALKALAESFPLVDIFSLDMTDYEEMNALSIRLKEQPIDILLNNAGIYGPSGAGFGGVDAAAWRQVLEVNTIAPLMLAQAFVDQVAMSGNRLIAIVSSKVGSIADNGGGGGYIYRSSKTAVNQVMKSLSIDLAGQGIRVISLHPGWVKTAMGGPNAEITIEESVSGLKSVLLAVEDAHSGHFFEYNGDEIPW